MKLKLKARYTKLLDLGLFKRTKRLGLEQARTAYYETKVPLTQDHLGTAHAVGNPVCAENRGVGWADYLPGQSVVFSAKTMCPLCVSWMARNAEALMMQEALA